MFSARAETHHSMRPPEVGASLRRAASIGAKNAARAARVPDKPNKLCLQEKDITPEA